MRAAASLLVLSLVVAPTARARPIAIGRTVEIPFGLFAADPCGASACDARHSGHAAGAARIDATPTRLSRAVLDVNGVPGGASLVSLDGGIVIAPTLTGFVATRSGVAGPPLWALTLPNGGDAAARLPSGELVLTGERGDLVVVDAATGTPRRHVRLPSGPATGAPLVLPDGTVVLSLGTGELAALDPETLAIFERLPLDVVTGPPVLLPNGELVLPASAALVVVDLAGPRVTRRDLGVLLQGRVAVSPDGTVWARTQNGELLAIDPLTGTMRAVDLGRSRADASFVAPVVALDGSVRLAVTTPPPLPGTPVVPSTAPTTLLAAVNAQGRELWRKQVDGRISGMLVDDAGTTVIVSTSAATRGPGPLTTTARGAVMAVDASGELRWRVDLDDTPQLPPTLAADGSVIVAATPPGRLALSFSTFR